MASAAGVGKPFSTGGSRQTWTWVAGWVHPWVGLGWVGLGDVKWTHVHLWMKA